MNRQIGVGDSKNVIVFDPLLTDHVIRRMRSGSVRIFNGNQWETLQLITQERIGVGASNFRNYRRGFDACGTFNTSRDFAQNLIRFLTQGRASFLQITLIMFIVEPPKLHSE